jgi:cytochrome c556
MGRIYPVLATAGLVLLGVAVLSSAQEGSGTGAEFEPVVSVMELMQQTITPATNQLWSAWEEPSTAAEWRTMEEAAITLLAASSLTAAGGTGPMDNDWVQDSAWQAFNNAMIAAGKAALEASRNQDQEGLLAAGDLLLPPCEGCHQQFNPAVVNAE